MPTTTTVHGERRPGSGREGQERRGSGRGVEWTPAPHLGEEAPLVADAAAFLTTFFFLTPARTLLTRAAASAMAASPAGSSAPSSTDHAPTRDGGGGDAAEGDGRRMDRRVSPGTRTNARCGGERDVRRQQQRAWGQCFRMARVQDVPRVCKSGTCAWFQPVSFALCVGGRSLDRVQPSSESQSSPSPSPSHRLRGCAPP